MSVFSLLSLCLASGTILTPSAQGSVPASAPGWVPFVGPMNVFHDVWYLLLIPLAIGVSWVYKAYRIPDIRDLPKETLIMSVQVIGGIVALAILLSIFIEYGIPAIPVE